MSNRERTCDSCHAAAEILNEVKQLQLRSDLSGADEKTYQFCDPCLDNTKRLYQIDQYAVATLSDVVIADASVDESYCDYCESYAELFPFKDPEEGAAGATYDICKTCLHSASRIIHDTEEDK